MMFGPRIMSHKIGITNATQGGKVPWSEVGAGHGQGGIFYMPSHIAMEPSYHAVMQQCTTRELLQDVVCAWKWGC